jgi:hypothetical protein
MEGSGRCRHHGGKSTGPKTEEGKEQSKMNATKHGLSADPVNLFDYLADHEPEAAAWILNKLYEYSQDAPKAVYKADFNADGVDAFDDVETNLTAYGDDLLMMCIRDYSRWRATKRQVVEGVISRQEQMTEQGPWETEDSNPVNLDLDRMDKTTMRQKDKLGVLPSPDAQEAQAAEDLATMIQQELE